MIQIGKKYWDLETCRKVRKFIFLKSTHMQYHYGIGDIVLCKQNVNMHVN